MVSRRQQRKEFELFALVHLDAIYRAALRLSRDPAEAEDLAQEVFFRAYRSFHQFERGSNCRAWLFKILKNTFINRERAMSQGRSDVSLGNIETGGEGWLEEAVALSGSGPEDRLLSKITGEQIKKAVEELPESFRRIFLLSEVEGFTYKEIARIEGCPLGTVMSRLYRARRMLQSLLRDFVEERDVRLREP
ncbi:MAG: sigma-70 family RNA polymerase sigma factor [Nitrospinota bacterium]